MGRNTWCSFNISPLAADGEEVVVAVNVNKVKFDGEIKLSRGPL